MLTVIRIYKYKLSQPSTNKLLILMKHKIINQLRTLALPLLLASLSIHCSCGKKPTNETDYGFNSTYARVQENIKGIQEGTKNMQDILDYTGFFKAVEEGKVDSVKKDLVRGLDVNRKEGDKTALHIATERGDISMMQALLQDPKINVGLTNKSNQTPLDIAFEKDNPAAVRLLLPAAKIDPKTIGPSGDNLFHKAIKSDKKAVADALMAAEPALINIANNAGKAPLQLAFEAGSVTDKLSKKLLSGGADVNAVDKQGDTLLHPLLRRNNIDIDMLKLLLDQGADVDAKGYNSNTPLHTLLSSNSLPSNFLQIAQELLGKVKDINAQNGEGDTFLHIAVERLQKPVVQALLQDNRIRADIINNNGETPIAIAEEIVVTMKNNEERKNKAIEIRDLLLNA